MNAIYSSEGHVRNDQFRPDYADLLVTEFSSGLWLLNSERPGLATSIEFDYDVEQEFARNLDQHSIPWQYKPRTFAVEWDEDGNFIDSFTPSFFLPARELYLEITAPDCRLFIEKARKARLLRLQYPAIRIEVLRAERSYQAFQRLCYPM